VSWEAPDWLVDPYTCVMPPPGRAESSVHLCHGRFQVTQLASANL
jgi:hypothetical protein